MGQPTVFKNQDDRVFRRGDPFVKMSLEDMLDTFVDQRSNSRTIAIVDVFFHLQGFETVRVASALFESGDDSMHAEESALQYLEELFVYQKQSPHKNKGFVSIRMYISRAPCKTCTPKMIDFVTKNQAIFWNLGIFELLFRHGSSYQNHPEDFIDPMCDLAAVNSELSVLVRPGILDGPNLLLLVDEETIEEKSKCREALREFSVRAAYAGAALLRAIGKIADRDQKEKVEGEFLWQLEEMGPQHKQILKHFQHFIREKGYEEELSPNLLSKIKLEALRSEKVNEKVFLLASGFCRTLHAIAEERNYNPRGTLSFFKDPKIYYLLKDEKGQERVVCLWNTCNQQDIWKMVAKCFRSLQVSYWNAPNQDAEERRRSGCWRICEKSFHRTYVVKLTTHCLENTIEGSDP